LCGQEAGRKKGERRKVKRGDSENGVKTRNL